MGGDRKQAAGAEAAKEKGPDVFRAPDFGNGFAEVPAKGHRGDQAEKLLPHPQDLTAFGFLNVKPRRDRSV
ncbi:MAG: hypothetical protein RLZZ436_3078 [Planctomycetota bacterium]|jgi:hypothetical protein